VVIYGKIHGEFIDYSRSESIFRYYYKSGDLVTHEVSVSLDTTELELISYNRNVKLELLGL